MTQAAEYLLKEIKCEATINDLIGVVCTEDNFLNGVKNIVCNYDANNILHQYAISNKEVSAILISHKQRRIKLTYTLKNGICLKGQTLIQNKPSVSEGYFSASLEKALFSAVSLGYLYFLVSSCRFGFLGNGRDFCHVDFVAWADAPLNGVKSKNQ